MDCHHFDFLGRCSEGPQNGESRSLSLSATCHLLVLSAFTLGEGSCLPRLQPALSQVEKNSKGNIIFKSLNVLSGCFGNLTSGKRSLVQAW